MKKFVRVIGLIIAVLMLAGTLAGCNPAVERERAIAVKREGYTFEDLLEDYHNPAGRSLVIAHRADFVNFPENSLEAIESCIEMGVDMVELDIRKSADGVWVLSHDQSLFRTTNGMGMVENKTAEELKQLRLKKGKGGFSALTDYKMPTFAEALEACRGRILINLDKISFEHKDEVYDILSEHDAVNCAIFKFSASPEQIREWFDTLSAQGKPLPLYSPKIRGNTYKEAAEKLASYQGLSSMAEIMYRGSAEQTKKLNALANECGMRAMRTTLLITNDYEQAWQRALSMGFNALMTNKPANMIVFINELD